jgi:hypothetical protein
MQYCHIKAADKQTHRMTASGSAHLQSAAAASDDSREICNTTLMACMTDAGVGGMMPRALYGSCLHPTSATTSSAAAFFSSASAMLRRRADP